MSNAIVIVYLMNHYGDFSMFVSLVTVAMVMHVWSCRSSSIFISNVSVQHFINHAGIGTKSKNAAILLLSKLVNNKILITIVTNVTIETQFGVIK